MESISIKVLNEILPESTRKKYFLNQQTGHIGVPDNGDGMQEEYNETFEYYRHQEMPENIFLQITKHTDSYGNDARITEMKFVHGKEKTITVYEPVKN